MIRRFTPFLITFGLLAVATLCKVALIRYFHVDAPMTLYYSAVIASAWFGGLTQGVLATILSIFVSYFTFSFPESFLDGPHSFALRTLFFTFDATVINWLCASMRRAIMDADQAMTNVTSTRNSSLDSQLRFRKIFESNMIGLVFFRHDGVIVECNDYVYKLTGYSAADVQLGHLTWQNLTPKDNHEWSADGLLNLHSQGQVEPFEKEYVHCDGTHIPVLVGAVQLSDDLFVKFVLDNRQSKSTEQALEERVSRRTRELRTTAEHLRQSQQFLDSVIENMPNLVFVKSAKDLRFLRINKAGEKILGIHREELLGRSDADFFAPEQAELFRHNDEAVLQSKEVIDIPEEAVSTRNGMRYLHTKKMPILDNDGKPIYLLGISEDITERKLGEQQRLRLLQEQLARSEAEKAAEHLRFLSEASAALNESLDLKSRLDAFAKLLTEHFADWCEIILMEEGELKIQEVVVGHRDPSKKDWAESFRGAHSIDWDQKVGVAHVLRTGQAEFHPQITADFVNQNVHDEVRLAALRRIGLHSAIIVPLQSYGRVIGALSLLSAESKRTYTEYDLTMVLDLAKRAAFAIENSRLFKKSQEASKAKSSFLANMSHEIRTPLGAMLGFAELLNDGKLSLQQKDYVSILLRNGRQLLNIVDEVLDLAKVESESIGIEITEFSLGSLLSEVDNLLHLQAEMKGLEFKIHVPDDFPDKIIGDPMRLRQILINVVGNAIKFTSNGGVDVHIELLPRSSNPQKPILQFTVTDTGIGISREQRERLFQPFMQADDSTTRRFGGTGLGLFLSRRLARLMGGDVVLGNSDPENGSRFIITLGIELKGEKITEDGLLPDDSQTPSDTASGHILVVDDSPDNRTLIQLYLSRMGFSAETAASGADGLRMAQLGGFDLVIMDVQMPGMDGFEAVRLLREQNYSRPIVALTAHTMKGDRERCMAGGFDDYLGKPIDRELLRQCLHKYVKSSATKRRLRTHPLEV